MGAMVHPSIWMVHPKCLLLLFDVYKNERTFGGNLHTGLDELLAGIGMLSYERHFSGEIWCHRSWSFPNLVDVLSYGSIPEETLPEWPEPMHVFHFTIMPRKVLSSVISMMERTKRGETMLAVSESNDAESSVVATTKQRRKRSISDCIGSACGSSKKPKKASISSLKKSFVSGTKRHPIEKDEQVAVKSTTGENIPRPNGSLTNFVFYDSDERPQLVEMLEICNVYVAVPHCLWKKVLIRGRKRVSDVNILGV